MRVLKSHNILIPLVFFTYSLFVNINFLGQTGKAPRLGLSSTGNTTAYVDDLYSQSQPHRGVAQAALGALRYRLLGEGRDGVIVAGDGWLLSAEELRPRLPDPQETALHAEILDAAAQVQALGGQVILLLLPTKAGVFGIAGTTGSDAARDALIAKLQSHRVPFLNATPALQAVPQAFFKSDTHWTTEGAEAVAHHFASSFSSLKGSDVYQRIKLTPENFTGDLVPFVTTAAVAPWIGIAQEQASPIEARGEGNADDLFAADAPEAYALVGTSYSANPRWSFTEALKLSLQHDVLNYAREGLGPLEPMQRYIEALKTGDAPHTVIWEFPTRYLTDPELLSEGSTQ